MGVRHTALAVFETWRTITRSARCSNDCGMVMSSVVAVFASIISSNFERRAAGLVKN
jgi:hypothetical protein